MGSDGDLFLEALVMLTEDKGEKDAIMDVCEDRAWCEMIGVKYTAKDVYTQIKDRLHDYVAQRGRTDE